ncbi:MAG: NAD(P)H-hydrate dehydratase [Rhodocyclaceae bacterium]|nr:NAD(P)H-hydrate dehydratase [Rhodocyclaceae bacterium]
MPSPHAPLPAPPVHLVDGIRQLELDYRDASPPLMERAGAAAAELAQTLRTASGPVLIACGPGNNGGDGLVVARLLKAAGIAVHVLMAGDESRLPDDAAKAMRAWRQAGGSCHAALPAEHPALIIDALFGIGLQRPLAGDIEALVTHLNGLEAPRLALDIPSGLDARTGCVLGCAIHATETLSFIGLKPGLLTADGPDHCGRITVADLGIPARDTAGCGHLLSQALFADRLVPRLANSHKGTYGDAVVIGGARGMIGAAFLAGRAALHVGAGRVFVGLIDTSVPALDPFQPELMVRSAASLAQAPAALAVGPGLGRSAEAIQAMRHALGGNAPLVLDADALNLLAEDEELADSLRQRTAPAVLTPHPAEAARMLGTTTEAVQGDRLTAAHDLAKAYGCPVLIKGTGSLIATPSGHWYINATGHPGMATAGMGDCLSGIIAGLIAQGWPAEQALLAGTHLHGAAADRLVADGIGPVGLTASETASAARRVLNEWISQLTPTAP